MKVQLDVDAALWRETKAEAAIQGVKLKRFVEGVLRNSLPYSKVSKIPVRGAEGAASGHREGAPRTGSATLSTGAKTPPVAVSAPPRAASEYRCKVCGKPTDGDYVCQSCKKE